LFVKTLYACSEVNDPVASGERDIFTGDSVDIRVINASGIRKETLQLKLD